MKCPICGKTVPPSKGVKPRKYCSQKCASKAAYASALRRGYKHPKKFRKICAVCGKVFFAVRDRQKCCSSSCGISFSSTSRGRKSRMSAKARLAIERKRLALENCRETAPITIEERDLRNSELGQILRIETRGFCPIGCHAVYHVNHNN